MIYSNSWFMISNSRRPCDRLRYPKLLSLKFHDRHASFGQFGDDRFSFYSYSCRNIFYWCSGNSFQSAIPFNLIWIRKIVSYIHYWHFIPAAVDKHSILRRISLCRIDDFAFWVGVLGPSFTLLGPISWVNNGFSSIFFLDSLHLKKKRFLFQWLECTPLNR